MTKRDAMQVAFHGAVAFLLGLLAGIPLAELVEGEATVEARHAWTVAHDTLILFGVLLLAVAGVGQSLVLGAGASRALLAALAVSVYASVVPLLVGPATGTSGLRPDQGGLGLALFALLMLALVALFVVVALLLRGTWAAWRAAG